MRSSISYATEILGRIPFGGLRLDELFAEIRRESRRCAGSPAQLLRELSGHPERFRILDLSLGPWETSGVARKGVTEPWVVCREPSPLHPTSYRTMEVMGETVRLVGCQAARHSFTAPARWLVIALEAEEAWRSLYRAAENQPEHHSCSRSRSRVSRPAAAAAA